MKNTIDKNRIQWIDIAKGLGILFVAVGHVLFVPEKLFVWVFSFHMPLFFFLAGVTYNFKKYNDFKFLIKNKFRDIVIPCIMFSVLTLLLSTAKQAVVYLKSGSLDKKEIISTFVQIFVQNPTSDYQTGVWFLSCIFICFILLHFIIKLSKNNLKIAMAVSFAFMAAGYIYSAFIKISLPWALNVSFVAVFFMMCGVFLQDKLKKNFECKAKLVAAGLISLIINIAVMLVNYQISDTAVDMRRNVYGNPILFIVGAFAGIVFVICLSNLFSSKAFSYIGNRSLYYYGAHLKIVAYVSKALKLIAQNMIAVAPLAYLITVVCAVLVLLVSTIFYPVYKLLYNFVVKICKLQI